MVHKKLFTNLHQKDFTLAHLQKQFKIKISLIMNMNSIFIINLVLYKYYETDLKAFIEITITKNMVNIVIKIFKKEIKMKIVYS